jgi:hypothetical protein
VGSLLVGLGLLVRAAFERQRAPSPEDLFRCFWLGFAAALGVLQAWNLWLPVDARASALLALAGLVGLVSSRALLSPALRRVARDRWPAAIACALAVWFADQALRAPDLFDTGNYHLAAIRWATDYATVRGLGNLDPRLAFNNSSFLYQAALEQGFWRGRSSHVGNGLLLLAFTVFCAVRASRARPGPSGGGAAGLLPALYLTPAVVLLLGIGIWNPETDTPAALLGLVVGWMLLDFAELHATRSSATNAFNALTACALVAAAPTVKLSLLFYCAFAWLAVQVLWLRAPGVPPRVRARVALACVALPVGFGLVWSARSVLLSGYPLFPSSFAPASVDWRVPGVYAEGVRYLIEVFARAPYHETILGERFDWLGYWVAFSLRGSKFLGLLPSLLVVASAALLARSRRAPPRDIVVALAPAVLSLPVWFLTAPSFRFGGALLWTLAAQLASLVAARLATPPAARRALALVAILPVAAIGHDVYLARGQSGGSLARSALARLWVPPGPDHGFHPVYRPALVSRCNSSGLELHVPAIADRSIPAWKDWVVWDGPLPAATEVSPYLALRGPTLASGFAAREPAGPWAERNAAAVARAYLEEHGSLRRTAIRLGVSPRVIREAFAASGADVASVRRAPGAGPDPFREGSR